MDTTCALRTETACSIVHRHLYNGIHNVAEASGNDESSVNFLELGFWSMQRTRETRPHPIASSRSSSPLLHSTDTVLLAASNTQLSAYTVIDDLVVPPEYEPNFYYFHYSRWVLLSPELLLMGSIACRRQHCARKDIL